MTIRCCAALAVVLATSLPAVAQEQGRYRDFQLGARRDHDMVNAISMMYGQPSSSKMTGGGTDGRTSEIVASRIVARWNGPGYAIALSRWAYGDAWRLVIESTSLNALARTGDARAIALDVQEGPQRQAERARREHQQQDDAEAAARTTNTAKFQP